MHIYKFHCRMSRTLTGLFMMRMNPKPTDQMRIQLNCRADGYVWNLVLEVNKILQNPSYLKEKRITYSITYFRLNLECIEYNTLRWVRCIRAERI